MAKSNLYYLIARDRKTNNFKVVDVDNSIEKIDLYTINYKNEKELLDELLKKGEISDLDTDVYIVTPKDSNDHTYVNYLNILYSDSDGIEEIAKGSLDKNMPSKRVDDLFNNFCFNMQYNQGFYDMVTLGKTCLYDKFTDYFNGRRYQKTYDVKYKDGSWALKSYPIIRNIYDAFSIFFNTYNYNDHRTTKNPDDNMYRKLIEDKLLYKIGYGNNQDQMTLFEFNEFKQDNGINEDKLLEVIGTFTNLKDNIFKIVDGRIIVNEELFSKLDEEDLIKIETLLDRRLITYLYYYSEHKNFKIVHKNDLNSTYDKLIEDDQKNLLELLKSKNIFDNAYSWITVYNKYMLGEEYGKQKRKGDQ